MKLRKDLLQGIERFLDLVSAKTRKRGRGYFARDDVLGLECVEADHLYTAVVRGGEDYKVSLEFAENEWAADCSCPMQYDCKHAVAVMLELQKRATMDGQKTTATIIPLPKTNPRGVPQPPRSPLYDRLVAHLGCELVQSEAEFIRKVQMLHANARFRQLTESDLGQVSHGHSFY